MAEPRISAETLKKRIGDINGDLKIRKVYNQILDSFSSREIGMTELYSIAISCLTLLLGGYAGGLKALR